MAGKERSYMEDGELKMRWPLDKKDRATLGSAMHKIVEIYGKQVPDWAEGITKTLGVLEYVKVWAPEWEDCKLDAEPVPLISRVQAGIGGVGGSDNFYVVGVFKTLPQEYIGVILIEMGWNPMAFLHPIGHIYIFKPGTDLYTENPDRMMFWIFTPEMAANCIAHHVLYMEDLYREQEAQNQEPAGEPV